MQAFQDLNEFVANVNPGQGESRAVYAKREVFSEAQIRQRRSVIPERGSGTRPRLYGKKWVGIPGDIGSYQPADLAPVRGFKAFGNLKKTRTKFSECSTESWRGANRSLSLSLDPK